MALGIALLAVLPVIVAAGYASFLFPIFSADLGLAKSDINNIFAFGQLIVYVRIGDIDNLEALYDKWRTTVASSVLLGAVLAPQRLANAAGVAMPLRFRWSSALPQGNLISENSS